MSEGDIRSGVPSAAEPCASAGLTDGPAEDPEPPSGGHPDRTSLELDVLMEAGDWSVFGEAERAVRRAAKALSRAPAAAALAGREATVVLGDDALVRTLNKTYRGKDSPTNVLSFPFQAPPRASLEAALPLGDVILAAETIMREADELGLTPLDHLQHLVIHGLLHLLGFDHLETMEAERMEAIEVAVLAGLGIADPYAGGEA